MTRLTNALAVLLAAATLGTATLASAGPVTIRLSDGITIVTVADGDIGPPADLSGVAGAVTFSGTIGVWLVNVTTGVGAPIFSDPHLDLNSINVSSVGGGAFIDLYLSQTDMTLGALAQLVNFYGSIGGTSVGTVTWELWVDDNNLLFAQDTLVANGVTVGSPFAMADSGSTLLAGPFSMTMHVRILHGNGPGTTSFDFEGFAVPEPGTIALLGIGLIGLALLRRRRHD